MAALVTSAGQTPDQLKRSLNEQIKKETEELVNKEWTEAWERMTALFNYRKELLKYNIVHASLDETNLARAVCDKVTLAYNMTNDEDGKRRISVYAKTDGIDLTGAALDKFNQMIDNLMDNVSVLMDYTY